jgi:membrane protease YdiL (CAAX protease family)
MPSVGTATVLAGAGAIAANEALLLSGGHVLGAQVVAGILVVLLINAGAFFDPPDSRSATDGVANACRALALVAVIPVAAAALPVHELSRPSSVLAVSIPLAAACIWMAHRSAITLGPLLRRPRLLADTAITGVGIPLGFVAYLLGAPTLASDRLTHVAAGVAALLVAGAVEELVFRGAVQEALQRVLGRMGVVVATVLSVGVYVGVGWSLVTAAAAAAFFAAAVARTRRLWGAMAGHALFLVGAAVVWPVGLGERQSWSVDAAAATGIIVSACVGLVVTSMLIRSHRRHAV